MIQKGNRGTNKSLLQRFAPAHMGKKFDEGWRVRYIQTRYFRV